ncbi:Histone deacetylase hda1 [Entomortierella beljakovae]|nr:Histone deacetylase hda1 [Entomortierella beljakovae]
MSHLKQADVDMALVSPDTKEKTLEASSISSVTPTTSATGTPTTATTVRAFSTISLNSDFVANGSTLSERESSDHFAHTRDQEDAQPQDQSGTRIATNNDDAQSIRGLGLINGGGSPNGVAISKSSPRLPIESIEPDILETNNVDNDEQDDPTQPRWSDHEIEVEGPILPQPELFNGRSTKTGYVYDVRMKHHNNVHGDDDHPEDPRRIWRIYDALVEAQLPKRMIKIPTREATQEELSLVHTDGHIQNITRSAVMNKEELLEMANGYNSIYLNKMSAFCARLSCGSLIELCKAVATGQLLNGLAIIRPPGHHAEPDEAGGFCLYNNVAIAARYLQAAHGLRKIFILDWDVHHGNGTQTVFYDDPDVVYCSIHRFDHGDFYPGDPIAGAHTAVGKGAGLGRNINIPWNSCSMGDSEYIYAFNKVIMPILLEFAPDFILVSAGFDAAEGDHIGQMLVSPPAYGHMTHMLKSMAGGKIILALEGGYNLDSIAVSGLACAKALLNDPIRPLGPITPNAQCVETIHDVIEVQSKYWKCLPQVYINSPEGPMEGRLDTSVKKILDIYREEYLCERYDMIKMPRLDGKQTIEFLENVNCTGEFCVNRSGNSNITRPEKSFLIDTVSRYVDHIVGSDNELIDIVQPFQPTTEEEKMAVKEKLFSILAEVWDNYVSTTGYTGRRIIFIATGLGCHALTSLLNERQKDIMKYVNCVVMVPGDDSLPTVTKKMGVWYTENSLVILTNDHPYYDRPQKSNNRNGNLIRSGYSSNNRLSTLLNHLRKSIFEGIESKLDGLPPVTPDDSYPDTKEEVEAMEAESTSSPALVKENDIKNVKTEAETNSPSEGQTPAPSSRARAFSPLPPVNKEDITKPEESPLASTPKSYPGSPLQNGYSIPRPISQPLVERPHVVGQQHRSQPYPSPNGRPYNSPVMSSSSLSQPIYPRGSTPQARGSDPKLASDPLEQKTRSTVSLEQAQYLQQQQYLEAQRHLDIQRQHQHQHQHLQHQQHEQYQSHIQHQQERADVRGGPFPYHNGNNDKPTPRSVATGDHTIPSPSAKAQPLFSTNGSPRVSHGIPKSQSISQPPQQHPPHHSSGPGSGVPQGNGSYRQGPPPMGPSTGQSNFEPSHHHRSSYSSQGPPPPPISGPPQSNGSQHHSQGPSSNPRQPGWSQQQQQNVPPPGRMKRSEQEPDPYGPPPPHARYPQHSQQPQHHSQQHQQHHHQQEMERQQRAEFERQRWEADQARLQQRMERRNESHGHAPPSSMHGHIHPQQQQQHQHQSHHHQQMQQQQQHHFEQMQERERRHGGMVKHPQQQQQQQHLQHPH